MRRLLKNLSLIFLLLGFSLVVVSCDKNTIIPPDGGGDNGGNNNGQDDDSWITDLTVRDYKGENGVVSAANPYAAKAGLDILKQGGNAFDAAVAVSFALGVVEPNASGLGGGGILVAFNANKGEYLSYNFREFVPELGTASRYGSDANTRAGIMSSGVPTQVAGLLKILEDNGVLTRQDVLAPAIKYANEGVVITPELGKTIQDNVGKLMISRDEVLGVFSDPFGILFKGEGETLIQKNYGKALSLISELGASGFYEGELADAIVALQEKHGGIITHDDLVYAMNNFPHIETPLEGTYRGYDVITATAPSSGGVVLLEVLNMLEHYGDLSKVEHNSVEYIHLLATALTLAYGDKRQFVGDARVNNIPLVGLTSKAYAVDRWMNFNPDKAFLGRFQAGGTDYGNPWIYEPTTGANMLPAGDFGESASTTTFSVSDSEGNIVSVTQTINHFYGNGHVVPGFGFFMNNELSSFSFTASNVNYIEPFKQPVSHIMPTIILKDGDPFLTLGSPGSMRIPAAVIQVVLNIIDYGMDIQTAINQPRIYSYAMASDNLGISKAGEDPSKYRKDIYLEKAFGSEYKTALEALGYYVIYSGSGDIDLFFGGVQGIQFNRFADLPLHGGADPRRDGKALGY